MPRIAFESKYELDSLMWSLRLATKVYQASKDCDFCSSNWKKAVSQVLTLLEYQQQGSDSMDPNDSLYYSFECGISCDYLFNFIGGLPTLHLKPLFLEWEFRPNVVA